MSRFLHPGLLRRLAIAFLGLMLAAPAFAQTPPGGSAGSGPPLPEMVAPDAAGVDLLNGRRVGTDSAISIGAADAPALQLTEGGGGPDGTPLGGFHYTDGAYPYMSDFFVLGSRGASNTFGDGTARSLPDGMQIQGNTLVEGDGTRWNMAATGTGSPSADRYLTTLVRPDGETLTYTYSSIATGDIRGRLRSIRSSAGYQLNVEWEPVSGSHRLKKVTLTNRRYAYCDPTTGACTGAYAWPTMSWITDASNKTTATTSGLRSVVYGAPQSAQAGPTTWEWTTQIISGAGVSRSYTFRGGVNSWGQVLVYGRGAGGSACPGSAAVWKVQEAGGPWNYSWTKACPSGFSSATRTDPLSKVSSRSGGTFTDELGRTSTYSYIDQFGSVAGPGQGISRVASLTYHEGNKVSWDWGSAYGPQNLLSTTVTPKPSVGGPTLTWTKGYSPGCNVTTDINCNKPIHEIDARGKRTDYSYDPVHGGIRTKILPADDHGVRPEVRYAWDQYRAKVLDSSGVPVDEAPIWKLKSTSSCRTQASCAGTADEVVTTYTYDDNLLVATETVRAGNDPAGSTVTNSYDPVGNLVFVDGPATGADDRTRYVYDALRRLVATMGPDPDGTAADKPLPVPVTRTTYNGDGQPTLVETGSAADQSDAALAGMTVDRKVVTEYDASGRKKKESLVGGGATEAVTQYSYDPVGRLQCAAVRMNKPAFGSLPGSACDLGTPGNLGPDRITRNFHDPAGQLETVQRAHRITMANGFPANLEQDYARYQYTGNGRRKSVTDANGNRAELRYDGHDRLSCWIFPSKILAGQLGGDCAAGTGDFESYGYDENGNRTTLRRRDGSSLTFHHDGLNRVTAKIVPARGDLTAEQTRDVHYDYDLRGLQTEARFDSLAGQGVSSVHDTFGRVASTTTTMGGVSRKIEYEYDARGNRTRIRLPDAIVPTHPHLGLLTFLYDYHYDRLDRPVRITNKGGAIVGGWTYDSKGRLDTIVRPGAPPSVYGYDGVSRVTGIAHDLYGDAVDLTLGFGHNPAGQIVTRSASNDAYGSTGAGNVSRGYQVNGLNQYEGTSNSGVPNWTYEYDPNGNLKRSVDPAGTLTTSFVYDVENRLVSASGAKAASLVYDPLGRLFQVSGGPAGPVQFLYDGDALVSEYDGELTRPHVYVHGVGQDVPMVWYEGGGGGRRLYADHQGSIVAIAHPTNAYLAVNGYDAWGIPNANNKGRFQYTGQVWLPELGMYHYKARIYSPTLGRFLQTDPIGYEHQVNLYAYLGNDPMNDIDPSGTDCYLCLGEQITNADGSVTIRSSGLLRALVPGQVAWDNARTDWANGHRGRAVIRTVAMAGEQIGTVLTGGAGRAAQQTHAALAQQAAARVAIARAEARSLMNSARSYSARAADHFARAAQFRQHPTVKPEMAGQSAERIVAQQQRRAEILERDGRMFEQRAREARAAAERLYRYYAN